MACLLLAGCGGGLTDGGGAASCNSIGGGGTGFYGTALYEDRLYGKEGFTARKLTPVRYAQVELRARSGNGNDVVIDTQLTNAGGHFCVTTPVIPAGTLTVRLKAVAEPPGLNGNTITVTDTSGDVYFLSTGRLQPQFGALVPVNPLIVKEADDQTAANYPNRLLHATQGGAFSILDTALGGFEFVKTQWQRELPNLLVSWQFDRVNGGTYFLHRDKSVINPRACDPTDPAIRSCTDRINMKGQQGSDSDEYDDDIALHEFGHFVLWNLSVDDSPGGRHYINGANQDARLSWSEGWANFFSTMVRDVNPGGFSNKSGERAIIIDAFTLTDGTQGALRFAYELLTPQAFVPDTAVPTETPVEVDSRLFKQLTKHTTSEVSVAVALWDIYAGGATRDRSGAILHQWRGIGANGMLQVIERMKTLTPVSGFWEPTTFTEFWRAYVELYPAHAEEIRGHFSDDRLMTLIDDFDGADDTVAELEGQAPGYLNHAATNMGPGLGVVMKGHTLFPQGDIDYFRLEVAQAASFVINTENLNDGADTYIEVFESDGTTPVTFADGSPAVNDNHIYWVQRVVAPTNNGPPQVIERKWIDYNGQCGRETVFIQAAIRTSVNSCPPNAANPAPHPNLAIPEYLSSKLTVDLLPGTYYIKVSRAPGAPPSAGKHGGYDLRVQGL